MESGSTPVRLSTSLLKTMSITAEIPLSLCLLELEY